MLDARLGVGEVGEIMARTPTVMKTFINRLKQISLNTGIIVSLVELLSLQNGSDQLFVYREG